MRQTFSPARKEHICTYCGHTIEKGERYHKAVYLPGEYGWEDFTVFKGHRFCTSVAQAYHEAWGLCWDEGVEFESVLSDLWEDWGLRNFLSRWETSDRVTEAYKRAREKGDDKEREERLFKQMIHAAKQLPEQLYFDDDKYWRREDVSKTTP